MIVEKLGPFSYGVDNTPNQGGREQRQPIKLLNEAIYIGQWNTQSNEREGIGQ